MDNLTFKLEILRIIAVKRHRKRLNSTAGKVTPTSDQPNREEAIEKFQPYSEVINLKYTENWMDIK